MHLRYRRKPPRHSTLSALVFIGVVCVLPAFVNAEQTLTGRSVEFSVQTYNDPQNPFFAGRVHKAIVSEGIEFGLGREGAQNNMDVVPILVDIDENSIEISFSISDPGILASARFNGYIIKFPTDCALLRGARIDQDNTNVEIDNKRISNDATTVMVNVSGLRNDRTSRIAVDLDVRDCPLFSS